MVDGLLVCYNLNHYLGYNFSPDDLEDEEDRILVYHRMVEAFKFAYAKRSDLGDEDFVDVQDVGFTLHCRKAIYFVRWQLRT